MFPADFTNQEIANVRTSAQRAEAAASRATEELKRLQRRTEELTLACQAMWELLSDTMSNADAQLQDKMREIDLRASEPDGKPGTTQPFCANCERPLQKKQNRCIYCGEEITFESVFQWILR